MKNKDSQFWYFLIEGKLDEETSAIGNFYTYGKRLGEALGKTYLIAENEGFINPTLIETIRLDDIEDFEIPEEAARFSDSVLMIPTIHTFDLKPKEISFKPPKGIAFSTIEGDFDQDLITESFIAHDKNESGIYEFQMVVDSSRLSEVFFNCCDFIEPVDAFWIYICNHWDDKERQLWASKTLTDTEKIKKFLLENKHDTIENGFIDIVVHSSTGKTNLMLCEHKKIQLHTESEVVFKKFIDSVVNLGFGQTEDFYNIEFGYHHWHYRPKNSLDRDEFQVMLIDNDFENIKK